jgi:hypothetical protein
MHNINDVLETQGHTYYFSISSSFKSKRLHKKPKEVIHEPALTSKMAVSFDLDIGSNIVYEGHAKPELVRS